MAKEILKTGSTWCVSGINRLTQEREMITPPINKDMAAKIKEREAAKPSRKRVYLRLKVEDVRLYKPYKKTLF